MVRSTVLAQLANIYPVEYCMTEKEYKEMAQRWADNYPYNLQAAASAQKSLLHTSVINASRESDMRQTWERRMNIWGNIDPRLPTVL